MQKRRFITDQGVLLTISSKQIVYIHDSGLSVRFIDNNAVSKNYRNRRQRGVV